MLGLGLALAGWPCPGARGGEGEGGARVEPAGPRDLASLMEPIRAKHDLPALGGAVFTADGLTGLGAVGLRRRGGAELVTPQDRWHLGSCTKAMTATLCAVLVEEKRLAWDLDVATALRTVAKDIDPGWKASTLDLLLHNRGGAPGPVKPGLWGELWKHAGPSRKAREHLVRGTLIDPPANPPGSREIYSNSGYALAGAMAEVATDTAWEDLLRKRLFAPLGMDAAGFGAPGTRGAAAADQPWGHAAATGKPVPPGPGADNPPAIGPAGTVHASLADWAKFLALHLRRGEGKPAPLPRAAFDRLHGLPEIKDDGYAMGWCVERRPWGGRVLMHAGSNTMWYCVTWLAPEKGFGVCVVTNTGAERAAQATDEAAWALIQDHLRSAGGNPTGK